MSSAPTPPKRPTQPGATPAPRPASNGAKPAAEGAAKPAPPKPPATKPVAPPARPAAESKPAETKPQLPRPATVRSVSSLPGQMKASANKPKQPKEEEKVAAPKKLNLALPEWPSVARGLMLLSWGWAGMNAAALLAAAHVLFLGTIEWLAPLQHFVLPGIAGVALLVYLAGQAYLLFTPEEADARTWVIAGLGGTLGAAGMAAAGWFMWQTAWPGWFLLATGAAFLTGFLALMLYLRQLAAALNEADLAMQSGLVFGAVIVTALILGIVFMRGIPPALASYNGIFLGCLAAVVALIIGIQWGVAAGIRWRIARW